MSSSTSIDEKYRPLDLGELIGQDRAVANLRAWLESPYKKSILFLGPPGTGKTTAMKLYAEMIMEKTRAKRVQSDGVGTSKYVSRTGVERLIYYFDSSSKENRGIDFVSWLSKRIKVAGDAIFILDEADQLTMSALAAMRAPIETAMQKGKIFLVAGNYDKFPPYFHSRCNHLTFEAIPEEAVVTRLVQVLLAEEVNFPTVTETISTMLPDGTEQLKDVTKPTQTTRAVIERIARTQKGDMRQSIKKLEERFRYKRQGDQTLVYLDVESSLDEIGIDVKTLAYDACEKAWRRKFAHVYGAIIELVDERRADSLEIVLHAKQWAIKNIEDDNLLKQTYVAICNYGNRLEAGRSRKIQLAAMFAHIGMIAVSTEGSMSEQPKLKSEREQESGNSQMDELMQK